MTDLDTGAPFVNGQEADASAVNAQFTAVETFLNTTGVHVYQAGTISNAAIAAAAEIAVSKLADGAAYDVLATSSDGTTVAWVSGLTANHIADGTITAAKCAADVATQAELDAVAAAKANLASPTFTGTPAAPTAAAGTNTTQLATTAFVTTADNLKANLASPTFTGTPAAPTAAAGTSTTQIATTAFVDAHITDATAAHAASAISILDTANDFTATNVEDALAEIQADIESISAGGIADGSVTTAKLASASVTAAKLARPEVGSSSLTSAVAFDEDDIVTMSSSASTWTNDIAPLGTHVSWDAVNKRFSAAANGLFRVNFFGTLTSAGGITGNDYRYTVYLAKNGTVDAGQVLTGHTVLDSVQADAYLDDSGEGVVKIPVSINCIYSLSSADVIHLAVMASDNDSATVLGSLTIEYLGPAS